ncbi:hypothetical protein MCEMSE6_00534 [Oxalobacteraceae bacterium]
MTTSHHITNWITTTIDTSSKEWLFLTFRADGYITNRNNHHHSVWNNGAVPTIERVKMALSWTITECRRKHDRKMRFAAFVGGEPSIGVFPHIHAFLELPTNTSHDTITEYLEMIWSKKLAKLLKQPINSRVTSQILNNGADALLYCSRYEGQTFSRADEKVILNNSFFI